MEQREICTDNEKPPTILKGYKDGLQPESLADGNWLVKQNQLVSKIETKSDTNLRSLYEWHVWATPLDI
jgi:predicted ATPase